MPVNGPPRGVGTGPSPLLPDASTPLRRSATTLAPPLGGATPRTPAIGGPPRRANSLPATAGLRAPQSASLPPRRDSLPAARPAPVSPQAGRPPGFAPGLHGFPGLSPHPDAQVEQLKNMAEQVESTQKTAQELGAKSIETANKAADGVKDAVSAST